MQLTEEQRDIQRMVRNYAQEKIAPLAKEIDETGRFPAEAIQGLADMALWAEHSRRIRRSGMDEICKVVAIEEVAKCCASTAEILAVHLLVNDIIVKRGTEEQKREFLPAAAEGCLGAFALTEAGAGTDAGGLTTKAVYADGHYVLNGTKCFISNMGLMKASRRSHRRDGQGKGDSRRHDGLFDEAGHAGIFIGQDGR